MIDLTALIATARAAVKEKDALKAAQAKARVLAQGAPHSPASKEATAQAAALLHRMSWTTVAAAFRETAWDCACGHSGRSPEGLFLVQEHNRLVATRYARPEHPSQLDGLPRARVTEHRTVEVCRFCAFEGGYREPYSRPEPPIPEVPHVVAFLNLERALSEPAPYATAVAWTDDNPEENPDET